MFHTTRDGGVYNTAECFFDNSDCKKFNAAFPGCTAAFPSRVGDGYCDYDEEGHSTKLCGFDGKDCDQFNIFTTNYDKCDFAGHDVDLLFNRRCDGLQ